MHSILIAVDRTAPTITIDTVTPNVLWPPNGKFVTVTVTGVATDSLSGVKCVDARVPRRRRIRKGRAVRRDHQRHPGRSHAVRGVLAQVAFSFQVMLQASALASTVTVANT